MAPCSWGKGTHFRLKENETRTTKMKKERDQEATKDTSYWSSELKNTSLFTKPTDSTQWSICTGHLLPKANILLGQTGNFVAAAEHIQRADRVTVRLSGRAAKTPDLSDFESAVAVCGSPCILDTATARALYHYSLGRSVQSKKIIRPMAILRVETPR